VTYLAVSSERHPNKETVSAHVRVDGGRVYEPALHRFPFASQAIGSPSVRSSPVDDVYLTLVAAPEPGQSTAVIAVHVKPLVAWLWIGGAVMLVGTVLAAWPGVRRRRGPAPRGEPEGDGAVAPAREEVVVA
jgi:cytochrome c-type biogenesis protein CcmF